MSADNVALGIALTNAAMRLAVTILCAHITYRFHHMMNFRQRFGMGLIGGAGFLTIPVVTDVHSFGTPFDQWAPALMTLGFLFLAWGFWVRLQKHDHSNDQAKREAEAYLKGKGKL